MIRRGPRRRPAHDAVRVRRGPGARPWPAAGADVVVAHMGLTTKGAIGATTALTLEASAERVQAIRDAAVAVKPDILVLCHGGPIAEPADAAVRPRPHHGRRRVLRRVEHGAAADRGRDHREHAALQEDHRRDRHASCLRPRRTRTRRKHRAPQGRSPRPVPRGRRVPRQLDVRDREAAVLGLRRPPLPATRSARCTRTSAAGGSPATTCSAASARRSRPTGSTRTSTATCTRPRSRPRPGSTVGDPGVRLRDARRRPRGRPGLRGQDRRRTSARSCRSTGSSSRTGGATALRPRDAAQLRLHRGHARRARTSSA